MKIQYGSIIVDGSGKLGGYVAARNKGGAYLRTKVNPSQPDTNYQEIARAQLATISSTWSTRTNAQRATWNKGVKDYLTTNIFGDVRTPSGINLYIKLNLNRLRIGYGILTTCPAKQVVKFAAVDRYDFPSGNPYEATITFMDDSLEDSQILVRATPPVSAGVTYITNKLRDIVYLECGGDTIHYGDEYVARFGSLSSGDIIWVTVTVIATNGMHGQTQKFRVIAT